MDDFVAIINLFLNFDALVSPDTTIEGPDTTIEGTLFNFNKHKVVLINDFAL